MAAWTSLNRENSQEGQIGHFLSDLVSGEEKCGGSVFVCAFLGRNDNYQHIFSLPGKFNGLSKSHYMIYWKFGAASTEAICKTLLAQSQPQKVTNDCCSRMIQPVIT